MISLIDAIGWFREIDVENKKVYCLNSDFAITHVLLKCLVIVCNKKVRKNGRSANYITKWDT